MDLFAAVCCFRLEGYTVVVAFFPTRQSERTQLERVFYRTTEFTLIRRAEIFVGCRTTTSRWHKIIYSSICEWENNNKDKRMQSAVRFLILFRVERG